MLDNAIIYLIGFPGSGKLTIARELQKIIPAILVDNHHINNVIFSLIDPDGESRMPLQVWKNIKKVREAVLDTIRTESKPGRNFIFTNALTEGGKEDELLFEGVRELAVAKQASFHVFRLAVDVDELCRRIVSPGRAEMFKDVDAEGARFRAGVLDVFVPKSCGYTDLDVTGMSAQESARVIGDVVMGSAQYPAIVE